MARLFFALWPGVVARARLAELARDVALVVGGKAMPADKIHLTLAFLGEIEDARLPGLLRAAGATRGSPFTLALDRVGSFRRARVAWAGSAAPPAALLELQADLAARLAREDFALEERAFAPHLTIARKIAKALPAASIPAIELAADRLALVRSETGTGRYTTVESWSLREG